MERGNEILLIEPEEAVRLGAKAFLASSGIFIDIASSRVDMDLSGYSLVIEAGEKRVEGLDVIFLQKPYTADELYKAIIDRGFNLGDIKP